MVFLELEHSVAKANTLLPGRTGRAPVMMENNCAFVEEQRSKWMNYGK